MNPYSFTVCCCDLFNFLCLTLYLNHAPPICSKFNIIQNTTNTVPFYQVINLWLWSLCVYIRIVYVSKLLQHSTAPSFNCSFIYRKFWTEKLSDPNNSPWEWVTTKVRASGAIRSICLVTVIISQTIWYSFSTTVITHTPQFTCQGQVPKVTFSLRLTQYHLRLENHKA